MKRRRALIILVVSLCAVAATWTWLVPHEPKYHGEPLSYWLSTYDVTRSDRPSRVDAERAIREIGSNAVPMLLKMLRARPSVFRVKLGSLLDRIPFITVDFTSPESLTFRALHAFAVLGPEAKSAVPALVADLSNPDASFRFNALNALASIHSEPALVLPLAVKFLQSPNYLERKAAAEVIKAYGAEARLVVPDLVAIARNLPPPPPLAPAPNPALPPMVSGTNQDRALVKSNAVVLAQMAVPITVATAPPQSWALAFPGEEARQALKVVDPEAARALMEELHITW